MCYECLVTGCDQTSRDFREWLTGGQVSRRGVNFSTFVGSGTDSPLVDWCDGTLSTARGHDDDDDHADDDDAVFRHIHHGVGATRPGRSQSGQRRVNLDFQPSHGTPSNCLHRDTERTVVPLDWSVHDLVSMFHFNATFPHVRQPPSITTAVCPCLSSVFRIFNNHFTANLPRNLPVKKK